MTHSAGTRVKNQDVAQKAVKPKDKKVQVHLEVAPEERVVV